MNKIVKSRPNSNYKDQILNVVLNYHCLTTELKWRNNSLRLKEEEALHLFVGESWQVKRPFLSGLSAKFVEKHRSFFIHSCKQWIVFLTFYGRFLERQGNGLYVG